MAQLRVTHVRKRDGTRQALDLNKVISRSRHICALPEDQEALKTLDPQMYRINRSLAPLRVDFQNIAAQTMTGIYPDVSTADLDLLAASIAQNMALTHPDYGRWASRMLVSNLHKNTLYNVYNHLKHSDPDLKLEAVESRLYHHVTNLLYQNVDDNGQQSPLINPHIKAVIDQNSSFLSGLIDYSYDYLLDSNGLKVMEDMFLLRTSLFTNESSDRQRLVVERPQHTFLREALGVVVSKPHVEYEIQRYQHADIWASVKHILARWIRPDKYQKLEAMADSFVDAEFDDPRFANLNWSKYLKHIDNFQQYEQYVQALRENTISWNALLNRYKSRNQTLTDAQKSWLTEVYQQLRSLRFTHATPTIMQAARLKPQLSSCYLIKLPDDSISGIAKYYGMKMQLAKYAGGIGGHLHNLRSAGAYIRGTNGHSDGVVPMLKVSDSLSVYVNQGGGQRPGSDAPYFSPTHPDIFKILQLSLPRGEENLRARHLFYALWVEDEFMRAVKQEYRIAKADKSQNPKLWYLMDPDRCPGLQMCWDRKLNTEMVTEAELARDPESYEMTALYRRYISEKRYREQVSARSIWEAMLELMATSSKPYVCFKDAVNRKSNHRHLGYIGSSNLCTEIMERSSSSETAVCNLVSICLTKLVRDTPNPEGVIDPFPQGFSVGLYPERTFVWKQKHPNEVVPKKWIDWTALEQIMALAVRNLDHVIDINYYPISKAKRSNLRHRPMGIGVQDYAGLLSMLRLPFDSDTSDRLNFYIFERMYYAALKESNRLAILHGKYETFDGSPASQGRLQMDLWTEEGHPPKYPLTMPWTELKEAIKTSGLRNSLLIALMPTATTSTLMNGSPAFEPHNALVYKRKNRSGELMMINTRLQEDLISLGLWNEQVQAKILESPSGGISHIGEIPEHVREIYKTAWDISPKVVIDHMLTRGPFVCQGQSMNLWFKNPTPKKITSALFYAWSRGGKNGIYYLRQLAVTDAQKRLMENLKDKECVSCAS